MNRKGTEKPIEIFVALFIILAVALVMLKLFQSQIAEKQKELSDVQQAQQSKDQQDQVRLACQQKCTEASNNGCSLASLASLCAFGSRNVLGEGSFIDLDNSKSLTEDTTLLAGVGICENNVYCFHMLDSCCAQRISPETCKSILTSYWTSKGFKGTATDVTQSPQIHDLFCANVPAGGCPAKVPAVTRWDTLAGWPQDCT